MTSFGKRKKSSFSHPVTPSELAFAAAEPPLDLRPAAPAALEVGFTRLLQSQFAAPLGSLLLRGRQISRQVSWVYPRVAGLAIAITLSVALAVAMIFSRMPERQFAVTGSINEIAAADPAQTTPVEPLGGIRLVDPPSDTPVSCDKAAWPYIDPRCFASAKGENDAKRDGKRETSKETGRNGKIGPRPIDSRSHPNPDQNIPIGSLTAIAPASPTLGTTDGVATSETGRADVAEPANSKWRAQKSVRTGDAGYAKKKKVRQVAEAGRQTGRAGSGAPETPPFIFPFSLFSQAR